MPPAPSPSNITNTTPSLSPSEIRPFKSKEILSKPKTQLDTDAIAIQRKRFAAWRKTLVLPVPSQGNLIQALDSIQQALQKKERKERTEYADINKRRKTFLESNIPW